VTDLSRSSRPGETSPTPANWEAELHKLKEQVIRDPLTGCFNRRVLDPGLDSLMEQCQQPGYGFSLVLIDLDDFKHINDTFGHKTGDECIVELSDFLQEELREPDSLIRMGGDEFLVLVDGITEDENRAYVTRLHALVREHPFLAERYPLSIHMSVGVFYFDAQTELEEPSDSHDILSYADKALYASKRFGGDRITYWHPNQSRETRNMPGSVSPVFNDLHAPHEERVLVVDDDPLFRRLLEQVLLREGYASDSASDVEQAVELLKKHKGAYDVLMTDLSMPGESGLRMLELARDIDEQIVSVVISGHVSADNVIQSLRAGAYDFLEKPCHPEHIISLMKRALEYRKLRMENQQYQNYLEDMVSQKNRQLEKNLAELKDAYAFSLDAMSAMLDAREYETALHSQRVMKLTERILNEMGIKGDQKKDILQGAQLHDIGKIAIPDSILLKKGPLNKEEWAVMRRHPEIGYRFVQSSRYLQGAGDIILSHHEAWDGSGYPQGLKGEEIPLGARIFTLVDCYDAMRSRRPYKNVMSTQEAVNDIKQKSGTQFDPEIVRCFLKLIPELEILGNWESTKPMDLNTMSGRIFFEEDLD